MKRYPPRLLLCLVLLLGACSSSGTREAQSRGSAKRSAGAGEYLVKPGDTLYSIAFRNQIDYHDLAEWNRIGRDYLIYPGRVLRLTPPGSVAPQSAAQPGTPSSSNAAARAAEPPVQSQPPPPIGSAFDAGRFEWPVRGKLLRTFDPDSGSKGIDIGGEVGQIVLAAAPGKVVYSGSALKGYGELVIVKHDEQYLSAYGYNRRRLVNEGEWVGAGQPIAELGEGPEQKPLLHFEIRDKGKPVDPLPLLPGR